MQYIEGSDLARMLSEDGRLRPYRAIDVCRQIAGALDAAHAQGLIHRDVKPANVLIAGRIAYLTDFGLTKRIAGTTAPLTQAGDVVGTIHYTAPEQIEGREVTARTDVYSLGCVLYHCLTGRMPLRARDRRRGHLRAPVRGAAEAVASCARSCPSGLDGVIAKALDKSPDRRFETCGDLMTAARGAVDAVGPLSETTPADAAQPRSASSDVGAAIEGMRDVAAAARRSRVLLAGVDASTRAIAKVALGGRVDVQRDGDAPARWTSPATCGRTS